MAEEQVQFQPQESRRVSPSPRNELDRDMMTTDPAWGQQYIPKELKDKLTTTKTEIVINKQKWTYEEKNLDIIRSDFILKDFTEINKNRYGKKIPQESQYIEVEIDTDKKEITQITYTKQLSKETLWEIHGYYTRDLRLGNIKDSMNPFETSEYDKCVLHLNMAGDLLAYQHPELPHGFYKAFFSEMRKVITRIELSHSKGGWFRKEGTTVRSEFNSNLPRDQAIEQKKVLGFTMGGNNQNNYQR